MRCFLQYAMARMGLWKPVIGSTYRPDEKFTPDPFDPSKKRNDVRVLDIRGGFVQYEYVNFKSDPTSNSIKGFASYYLRNKP